MKVDRCQNCEVELDKCWNCGQVLGEEMEEYSPQDSMLKKLKKPIGRGSVIINPKINE